MNAGFVTCDFNIKIKIKITRTSSGSGNLIENTKLFLVQTCEKRKENKCD